MSKTRILITGASGLVGKTLSHYLHQKGYEVSHLGRKKNLQNADFQSYTWNIGTKEIEEKAISTADYIVHLAGENVGEGAWTKQRKQVILDSRTQTTNLLFEKLQTIPNQVKGVISASAIGLYGLDLSETAADENSPAGTDFLANVTVEWEKNIDQISTLGKKVVKLRIGVVLDKQGGALAKMIKPIQWGVGAPLASGKQYLSWIHPHDLCGIIEHTLKQDLTGAYNAVAPHPITNEEMTKILAKKLKKTLFLPHVPAFALRLALGEMADIAILGKKVSSQKIQNTGFTFQYPEIEKALENLLQ